MKSTYIQVRISERDKAELKHQAEANEMTMSEYIIFLIHRQEERSNK